MDKLPQLSGREVCRVLEKDGFVFVRQTGSHKIYQKSADSPFKQSPQKRHVARNPEESPDFQGKTYLPVVGVRQYIVLIGHSGKNLSMFRHDTHVHSLTEGLL